MSINFVFKLFGTKTFCKNYKNIRSGFIKYNVDGGAGEKNNCEEVKDIEQCWRGCSMQEIHRYLDPFELEHFAAVRPSEEHTVLHNFPIQNITNEPPRPYKCHHKWDAMHVRLPSSANSQYPVIGADGKSSIQLRWEMIEQALLRPINNSRELHSAILEYNSKYKSQWSFRALHYLFEDDLDESEARAFFDDLLPRIIRLALRLPELILAPIPLLRQGKTHSVTLTQQQISCLLANAFLCTFPRRNSLKKKSEYSTFPDINFNRLYQSSGSSVIEKIKCICHYFRRVCPAERDSLNVPPGVVTFSRRNIHYSDMPKWVECETPLGATPIHITSAGTIEDQGEGLLQVDFANKYIGGGVLGSGCVQEEIRFVICPELIVSKLFTESLRPTEALLMIGCERFSIYKGYASTFQWCGNYADSTPCDSSRRRLTHIVAIDALSFVQSSHQYREELMLRELNKAYVGFYHPWQTPAPGIASGNWGCGAFRGDAKLKALLQLMACAVTKRPLVYFTFGDAELRDEVYGMHNFCMEQNVRVNDMWTALRKFHTNHLTSKDLYNFLYSSLRNEPKHSPNSRFDVYQPKCLDVKRAEKILSHRRDRDVSSVIEQTAPAPSTASVSKSLNIYFGDIKTDDISIREPIRSNATPENVSISTNCNAGVRENSCTSNETKSPKICTAPRQRTLLEMMDIYYKIDSSAPKRHCLHNK